MDYKIVKKEQFTLIGAAKVCTYEEAAAEIPQMWAEYELIGKNDIVCSAYGVSIDETMEGNTFEYLIADIYNPAQDIAKGFVTRVIPQHTWAAFACRGANPRALEDTQEKIFSHWLPNHTDYEIAAGYNIEMYSDPADYAHGVQDDNYYCEIWIPVRQK